MKGFLLGFLRGLKFPLRLLVKLFRKRQKVKDERKQKQIKHVRNFDPTRLKNVSFQVRAGKKQKEYYRKKKGKFSRRKANNFSKDRNC